MTRKRSQKGTIFKARGFWYVRFFEDRLEGGTVKHVRVAKQVGAVTTRSKYPPESIKTDAEAIVNGANSTNATPERVVTISDFVERIYQPHVEQFKRPSTQKCYRDIWNNHVKGLCGHEWLKNVRTYHVQGWLDALGKSGKLGRNSLQHIKSFLSAVFKYAKQQGYYMGENPVRDTATTPTAKEPGETYAYTLEDIQTMLAVLPERAAAVFAVAAFAGLRRGELQGLLWENYQDGVIRVTRSIWEGHITDPKTKRSKGAIPVIKQLADRLDMYRLRFGNPQSGPMFANSKKNPLNLNNLLGREIQPALERCKICRASKVNHLKKSHKFERDETIPKWKGWHAARRGLGSNLYNLGTPEKVIQEILRHANVTTTTSYYIKTVPQQLTDAMAKLEQALPEILSGNKVATEPAEEHTTRKAN